MVTSRVSNQFFFPIDAQCSRFQYANDFDRTVPFFSLLDFKISNLTSRLGSEHF